MPAVNTTLEPPTEGVKSPPSPTDPECLQCGEKRGRVRSESLFCCTVSGYEVVEVDQEWPRHRWADWTDRELDRYGVKASAYERHRRTDIGALPWIDCIDTKRGHSPADEESVNAMWVEYVGQCMWCGHDTRPGRAA